MPLELDIRQAQAHRRPPLPLLPLINMEQHLVIAGAFHYGMMPANALRFNSVNDSKTFPENVTLGFRGMFWRIFSDVTKLDAACNTFIWLDTEWQLHSGWITRSMKRSIDLYLDDSDHYFVIFHISNKSGIDASTLVSRSEE